VAARGHSTAAGRGGAWRADGPASSEVRGSPTLNLVDENVARQSSLRTDDESETRHVVDTEMFSRLQVGEPNY